MKATTQLRAPPDAEYSGWAMKLSDEFSATKTCVHYWLIDEAVGPSSKGKCKRCGEEKIFQNYWYEEPLWQRLILLLPPVDEISLVPEEMSVPLTQPVLEALMSITELPEDHIM